MASPPNRSPFKEYMVNGSRSLSPLCLETLSSFNQKGKHDNDENSIMTSHSYSPTKRSSKNVKSFHGSGRAFSMDATTIASLRIHSVVQSSTTASSQFDGDEKSETKDDKIEDLPPTSPTSNCSDTPDPVLSPRESPERGMMDLFNADNPFDSILNCQNDVKDVLLVETVTSKDSSEDSGVEQDSGIGHGFSNGDVFDIASEDIVEAPSSPAKENKEVVDEPADKNNNVVVQNPFEQFVAEQPNLASKSEDSDIFMEPAPQDDSYSFPNPFNTEQGKPQQDMTLNAPSCDNLRVLSSDAFSGLESKSEAEPDPDMILNLKTPSDSSDDWERTAASKKRPWLTKAKSSSSFLTDDTYGHFKSMTDRTPKIENLSPMTPPLTPKQRYLEAVRRSSSFGKKEVVPLSPRDRYLLAVQQAAAKCKTLVGTPKEIITGPNLTPKSSVKAQIKRVESGSLSSKKPSSGDSVLFIPTSPDRVKSDEDEEQPSEFGIPMFESESAPSESGRTAGLFPGQQEKESPERQKQDGDLKSYESPVIRPRAIGSAFHTFGQDTLPLAPPTGELPVKEEIDEGSDTSPIKSYLQLDLEATGSSQKLGSDEHYLRPSSNTAGTGPMEALRSSLALIWNSKPIPEALKGRDQQQNGSKRRPTSQERRLNASPVASKGQSPSKPSTACCNMQPEASAGAMESIRTSLIMIWNSKPRPKLMPGSSTPSKDSRPDYEVSRVHSSPRMPKDIESQARGRRPSYRQEQSDCKRERVYSEDSDASSYRRNDRKKTRHADGLSARHKPPSRQQLPMGSQYLTSSRGQSTSRERTVTPIPFDQDDCSSDLLGKRRSYDSMDDAQAQSKFTSDAYRNPPRYAATPSPVKPVATTETEDSFINAALTRNVDDVVVIYSGKPDTLDWHPPEQERKEHDTMVRAILERPSLIDKSIRESSQPSYSDWRQVRKWVLIAFAMILFTATIAGCLACGITGSCARREVNVQKEQVEEEVQPLVLNLPIYTQEALNSLHTAQTKAYFWLESDPNRQSYSEARTMQRFALATLYYSTKIAQNWTVSTSWLSYDIHECYWFSSYEGVDVCEGDEIKHLVLSKNNLRGNIPPEIALLTSLVELDLSRNVLIGPIPEELGSLTSLEKLSLEKNELNGSIPSQIKSMTSLTSLALATNDLQGPIPSEMGMLTELQRLQVFYNYLTGPIPTEIGLLTNLEVLDVDVNHLSGTIPAEIGQLSKLKELWLDWNNFVGPIPTELGMVKSLEKLYLGRAFVEDDLRDDDWRGSGRYTIPSELGQLSNLLELYLDNNNLTGMIPTEFSLLTSLQRATLDNNLLTDSISPGVCALFGDELESLTIDCEEVLCSCGCTCV